jgi:hypothetical protein
LIQFKPSSEEGTEELYKYLYWRLSEHKVQKTRDASQTLICWVLQWAPGWKGRDRDYVWNTFQKAVDAAIAHYRVDLMHPSEAWTREHTNQELFYALFFIMLGIEAGEISAKEGLEILFNLGDNQEASRMEIKDRVPINIEKILMDENYEDKKGQERKKGSCDQERKSYVH